MSILVFAGLVIIVLILVIYVIRKLAPSLKADADLVNLLEVIAIIIAILVILDRAGLLHT